MARFVPERPDIMTQMERDQRDAELGGSPADETLQYLIDKYRPSWRELRRIRNPLGSFTSVPGNERILISDKTTRREINLYNRTQRLVQEIGAMKEDWNSVDGKIRKVWVYILLIAADQVRAADKRAENMEIGIGEKRKRLQDKLRSPRTYRRRADAVRANVEAAIRKGRRRGGRGSAGVT